MKNEKELVRYLPVTKEAGIEMLAASHGEYVRYDQAVAMLAVKDAEFNKLEATWLNAEGKIKELEAELATLKEINANLMGDDEDKPRYTTKRLNYEIEKAVAAELAKIKAQEPIIEG